MPRPAPYFMHDQARHRVARLMGESSGGSPTAPLVWPLITLIAALTVINILTAIPGP